MSKKDEKFLMNGPVEFEMKIWVRNDETEQTAKITYSLPSFKYPTPEDIANAVSNNVKFEGALEGFRLMTKRETFEAFTLEKTGERFALIGGDKWDAIKPCGEHT